MIMELHNFLQKQPQEVHCKKSALKNFVNLTGKQLCWSLFLIKLQTRRMYWQETPTQVFSCEICKIFNNTYFKEHLRTTTYILGTDIISGPASFFLFSILQILPWLRKFTELCI